MFTQSIPFAGHHGSIVIGKGGKTITQIETETGCYIETKKPEPQYGRPLPYFYISGYNELMVLRTTMRIQQLILKSNSRTEKELIEKTTMLKSEISKIHLEQENKTVKKVRFNLKIKNNAEGHTDDIIIELAKKNKSAILTNDRELKNKATKEKIILYTIGKNSVKKI